jgi:hypothetical protein
VLDFAKLHGQLVEQVALARRQPARYAYIHQDVEIAACTRPAQERHAPATQSDFRSGLRAGLDLDLLVALRRGDGYPRP